MSLFKKTVLAETEDLPGQHYAHLLDEIQPYDNAFLYFEELYSYRETFAHCYRPSLPSRGNHTNNFVAIESRPVLKDSILKRAKEYNVVALLDRLLIDLGSHNKEKLLVFRW